MLSRNPDKAPEILSYIDVRERDMLKIKLEVIQMASESVYFDPANIPLLIESIIKKIPDGLDSKQVLDKLKIEYEEKKRKEDVKVKEIEEEKRKEDVKVKEIEEEKEEKRLS